MKKAGITAGQGKNKGADPQDSDRLWKQPAGCSGIPEIMV
jgi:hypothetical protein